MAAETIVEEFFRLANQISRYAPLITHEQNVRETGGNIPRWTPLGGERISNSRRLQGYLAIQNPRLTWLCIRISSVLRRLERAEGNGVAEIMALHVASLFREGRVQIFSSLRRDLRRMETQLQKFERSDSSVIQTANRLSQLCGVNRAKIVGRAFLAREKQIFEENSRIEGSDNDYNDSVLVALAAGFYLCSEPENIIRDLDDFVLEIYPSLRDSLARGDYLTDLVSRFLSEVPVDRFPGLVSNLIQTGSYSSSYFHPIKRRYGEIDAANKHALVLALLSGKSVGFGIEFIEEQDPGYLRQNLSDLDFSRVWLALMGNHGWDVDTPSTDLIREGFPLLEKGIVPITDLRKEVFDRFFQSLQGEVSVERFHECLKRVRSDELAQCLFIRGGVKAKCGDQLLDGVEARHFEKMAILLDKKQQELLIEDLSEGAPKHEITALACGACKDIGYGFDAPTLEGKRLAGPESPVSPKAKLLMIFNWAHHWNASEQTQVPRRVRMFPRRALAARDIDRAGFMEMGIRAIVSNPRNHLSDVDKTRLLTAWEKISSIREFQRRIDNQIDIIYGYMRLCHVPEHVPLFADAIQLSEVSSITATVHYLRDVVVLASVYQEVQEPDEGLLRLNQCVSLREAKELLDRKLREKDSKMLSLSPVELESFWMTHPEFQNAMRASAARGDATPQWLSEIAKAGSQTPEKWREWRYSHALSPYQLQQLNEAQRTDWIQNWIDVFDFQGKKTRLRESDDLGELTNLGVFPVPNCLAWRGGLYSECLPGMIADGNKKVLFIESEEEKAGKPEWRTIGMVVVRIAEISENQKKKAERGDPALVVEKFYWISGVSQSDLLETVAAQRYSERITQLRLHGLFAKVGNLPQRISLQMNLGTSISGKDWSDAIDNAPDDGFCRANVAKMVPLNRRVTRKL